MKFHIFETVNDLAKVKIPASLQNIILKPENLCRLALFSLKHLFSSSHGLFHTCRSTKLHDLPRYLFMGFE